MTLAPTLVALHLSITAVLLVTFVLVVAAQAVRPSRRGSSRGHGAGAALGSVPQPDAGIAARPTAGLVAAGTSRATAPVFGTNPAVDLRGAGQVECQEALTRSA